MTDFQYAPEPKVVDGLTAVAIHIDQVTAAMSFDGGTLSAQCTAEMAFTIGPDPGNPFFDLRQTITSATLDGSPFPLTSLAHHDFGGGVEAELRIIEQSLAADSSHILGLTYMLDKPDAPSSRDVVWTSGPRLSFDFHLSDLNPSRYLESWLPSNMLFDTFPVTLAIQITNSSHPHTILTNGTHVMLGLNHWQVNFPSHFASCSPLLLIEAEDQVERHTVNVTLTGGTVVTLDLIKRVNDTTLNLSSAAATLAGYLDDFHTTVGPYMHGSRFSALLASGPQHSMEYDGGTTSQMGALRHEVFHSWWARGMVPAREEDGWLDEAWTTYNMAPSAIPLDMSDPPLAMWTNNPFVRKTHGAAYVHGSSVFSGIAADMGIVALKSHMAAIYNERQGRRFTTPQIEAELIRRSGSLQIARYFNKFVYGFHDLASWQHPDLFLRDAGDDPGDVPYSGIFWLSPDVWVRRADDGGTVHQNPEHGQDNWFYARLHNRGNVASRSFVVGWRIKVWAGTEFVFPGDWFPLTAAKIGFDLAPGETRIVKARWPKEDIPPVGSHGCLLALVFDPDDPLATGAHVWEHNNLAQRNMTVVDLFPDEFALLDFWLGSRHWLRDRLLVLELVRPQKQPDLDVRLTHKSPELIKDLYFNQAPDRPDRPRAGRSRTWYDAPQEIQFFTGAVRLLPGAGSKWSYEEDQEPAHGSPRRQADLVEGPDGSLEIKYHDGVRVAFPVTLPGGRGLGLRLRFRAPAKARPGDSFRFDLIQRAGRKQVFGGFSVQINIKE